MSDKLREAAQAALDWLKDKRLDTWQYMEGSQFYADRDKQVKALESALAETAIKESLTTAKPVAWMSTKMAGVVIAHQPEDFQRHPDRWQPLYAAQMLRPETEYICKCGIRVTPHRCKTDMEF